MIKKYCYVHVHLNMFPHAVTLKTLHEQTCFYVETCWQNVFSSNFQPCSSQTDSKLYSGS